MLIADTLKAFRFVLSLLSVVLLLPSIPPQRISVQSNHHYYHCDAFQILTVTNTVAPQSKIATPSLQWSRIQQQQKQKPWIVPRISASTIKRRTATIISVTLQQSTTPTNGSDGSDRSSNEKIPFIIERVPNHNPSSSSLYNEIAQMCITAFFNTDNTNMSLQQQPPSRNINSGKNTTPFWREWQLAYLRTLQAGDLERRRVREPYKNRMFIARRAIPISSTSSSSSVPTTTRRNNNNWKQIKQQRPLILDTSRIRNINRGGYPNGDEMEYMLGDIIGFVEVTQRPYGLGEEGVMVERFVLTNLSVDYRARQSGVGTALVQTCEQIIYQEYCRDYVYNNNFNSNNNNENTDNNNNNSNNNTVNGSHEKSKKNGATVVNAVAPDMILEVEDDNMNAISFYRNRNYVDVCLDPTSRRYDLSGIWLQQTRCQRLVMKKDLRTIAVAATTTNNGLNGMMTNMENTVSMGIQAFQRLRDTVLNKVQQ